MAIIKMLSIAATLALTLSNPSFSQDVLADGQVVKIDERAGKITVTHGPIRGLGINESGRTDEFAVKDGLVFNALKEGDKIRFAAERVNGEPTITRLEK
jgi:Cu(I)/Ag(I) efflux system periplasmic protein CusF